ncbi:hypothetical protein HDE_05025 [Halotydeus destructor]|nr:hypothetical protein HDE_05025 [Halotydeus destructor]
MGVSLYREIENVLPVDTDICQKTGFLDHEYRIICFRANVSTMDKYDDRKGLIRRDDEDIVWYQVVKRALVLSQGLFLAVLIYCFVYLLVQDDAFRRQESHGYLIDPYKVLALLPAICVFIVNLNAVYTESWRTILPTAFILTGVTLFNVIFAPFDTQKVLLLIMEIGVIYFSFKFGFMVKDGHKAKFAVE